MINIKFERRAVAFIDVLGFKELVRKAIICHEYKAILDDLISTLKSVVPSFDKAVAGSIPKRLIPKHIYISDSIILSAPLKDDEIKAYDGLEVIIMRSIQLTHTLLSKGYLLRGGIEIGDVFHDKFNIIGPAYQDAYKLEAEASVPRIILGSNAVDYWRANLSERNRMCIERDLAVMVNGVHEYYIDGNDVLGAIESKYEDYEKIVTLSLNNQLKASEKAKWLWFGEYLAAEKKKSFSFGNY